MALSLAIVRALLNFGWTAHAQAAKDKTGFAQMRQFSCEVFQRKTVFNAGSADYYSSRDFDSR
jgi:hypothetical protein